MLPRTSLSFPEQAIVDPGVTVGDYYRFDTEALDANDRSFLFAVMRVSLQGFFDLKPNMKRWRQSLSGVFEQCIKKIPGPKRSLMDAFVLSSSMETCLKNTRIHGEDGRVVNFTNLPFQKEVRKSLGMSDLVSCHKHYAQTLILQPVDSSSSSSSSVSASDTDTSCTLQDNPEVDPVGIAIVATLHRRDLRWTEALLFFVEVAQHAFDFRQPPPADILTPS
jgi:hypothetical protein